MKKLLMDLKDNNIQLQVVNGELKVFAESNPDPSLIAEIKKWKKELLDILSGNGGSELTDATSFFIPLAAKDNSYVLSSSQRRLWLLNQLEPDNPAYNLRGMHVFEGTLDTSALDYAFNTLVTRHEILRTVFKVNEHGEPAQYVLSPNTAITYVDLRSDNSVDLNSRILNDITAPFDLSAGPLLRATLYRSADQSWVFCYVMHHIIGDAWSTGVLVRELLSLYNARINGVANPLRSLRLQYKDYAVWQQNQLSERAAIEQKNYWIKQFDDEVPVLNLISGKARPAVKSHQGAVHIKTINALLTKGIKKLSADQGGTLFMGMLAAVNALLYRYSTQEDIVIGTSIASREHIDLENQIGFYVNTLPLRTRFRGDNSFRDLFSIVKDVTLGAYAHQTYPFDELVDALNLERDNTRHPLFDVMVVLQNINLSGSEEQQELGEINVSSYEGVAHVANKFDLTFFITDNGKELLLRLVYNRDIYEAGFIAQLAVHLEQLLDAIVSHPELSLHQLQMLNDDERTQLLETFGTSDVTYAGNNSIVDLFEEQVEKTPDTNAVIAGSTTLTYRELNEKADRLAYYLSAEFGIIANDRVGILLDRSVNLIVAILGILKAGAAYVVIEPDNPVIRKAHIIEDAGIKALITMTDYMFDVNYYEGHIFAIDIQLENIAVSEMMKQQVKPTDLAYLVYTSGTTGNPKGVMITHQSVVDYYYGILAVTNIRECRSFGLVSTVAADLGNTVIYSSLLKGGSLHIFSAGEAMDGEKMFMHKVDCLKIVPSHWKALQDDKRLFVPEKCLIFGGEPLTDQLMGIIRNANTSCEVYNHYGPSETTIGKLIKRVGEVKNRIPLGKPFGNTTVYILDDHNNLMPPDAAGEICISGSGLAKGYLNQPTLTAQKFVENCFRPGERMYKTGDLGVWSAEGDIFFLGRKDDQVKIRGYRIELAEIERALAAYEGVRSVVVIAHGNTEEKELVAYWVGDEEIDPVSFRKHLGETLPAYMVPAHFLKLDQLPLNRNGKIDRKRLPAPEEAEAANFVAPRNETEEKLADLWKEVLKKKQVSVTDNFFDIGGHSLRATRLVSLIHKTFQVNMGLKDIFATLVLEDQAVFINNARKTAWVSIEPAALSSSGYPLSSAQYRLWVLSQFEEGNVAYNVPAAHVFEGRLDRDALTFAFNNLVTRHEILRTVFREDGNGEVRQFVLLPEEMMVNISFFDLSQEEGQEQRVQELVRAAFRKPFNLADGPLITASLISLSSDKCVFTYVMHHIISDAWSKDLLVKELLLLYNRYLSGDHTALPALHIQYKDYAVWQRNQLNEPFNRSREYWLQTFEGELPVLELPADRPRPLRKTYNGAYAGKMISKEIMNGIHALGKEGDSTLFMSLLTAVNVLLYRYTGQEDIITGTLIAGREHADLEDQIGFYINTLAIRARFKGADSFPELQQYIRQVTLNAFEHQSYPFDELVRELERQHDMNRNPLFDVCVVLQNARNTGGTVQGPEGLKVNGYRDENAISSRFDLIFDFVEYGDELKAGLVYNTDLYNSSTAARLLDHFEQLLSAILKDPATPVAQLDYLRMDEKQQVLHEFNQTTVPYPHDKTIVDLFRAQAKLTPETQAVTAGDVSLTYEELNRQSDQLAVYLRENYHVQAGDFVSIMMDRSEKLIIAILGVLKAGAAYVPVDPAFPADRKEFMLKDTGSKVLITQMEYIAEPNNYEGSRLEMEVEALMIASCVAQRYDGPHSTDLAYVMYTSGSTGAPKGVLIEHRSVIRLIKPGSFATVTTADVLLSTGAIAFDATTFEYWSMLLNGGTLILCDNDTLLDSKKLSALIRKHGVSIMWFTAGWLNQLVDADLTIFNGLKTILAGGDKLSETHIRMIQQKYPDLHIINGYGPTENTTFSVTALLDAQDSIIPIGKPVCNSTAYILDAFGQLCPVGVTGEIYVGGGLARGYLNNESLTAEKFINDPFREGRRMYKTGDLGRWMPDGNIIFLGRRDDQVKVNGFRVEPGEIANTIQLYPGISSSVVIAKTVNEGDKELRAYFTGDADIDISELHRFLSGKLPVFMIPAWFKQLEVLPLNANGKVDRNRLPEPEGYEGSGAVPYVAPRNGTEEKLVAIWFEILGRQVSVKDNFFDAGGHSLRATRLVSLIHKTFDVNIGLKDIFAVPVLEEQAVFIRKAAKDAFIPISPVAISVSGYPLSSAQYRLWVLSQFEEVNIAYNVKNVHVFQGGLDSSALTYAFNALIERHEVLRTVFRPDAEGEIKQFILSPEEVGFRIAYHDMRGQSDADNITLQLVKQDFILPFNLAAGPLVRASLIQKQEQEWVFTYVTHHIVSDGWSRSILMNELMSFYDGYVSGSIPELKPLRIQYKDFSVWEKEQLAADLLKVHKDYWVEQFSGSLPVLELPVDKLRPAVKTYNGAAIRMAFSKELSDRAQLFVSEQGGTLFMALLAAVNALFYRYTAQEDIIIGSPIAGREHADLEDQIGFYVNTLALRTRFKGTDTYRELLENVKQVALGAYEHQIYPFDKLVNDLDVQRDRSRNPLFDVQVIVQNAGLEGHAASENQGSLTMGGYDGIGTISCVFDMVFDFTETTDGLQLRIAYNSDIYSKWIVQQLGSHLEGMLAGLLRHPDKPVSKIDFFSEEDRQRLITGFNDVAVEFPKQKTITDLFEDQVKRTPENDALIFRSTVLSYRQLDEKANQLAAFLQQNYQVQTNDLVGIMLDRSEHMVIAMLGVLKAGAAYVPVNPEYPRSRRDYIIKDTAAKVMITKTDYLFDLDTYDGTILAIDIPLETNIERQPRTSGPNDLMYVIYTSGSTGEPKGVMVETGGLANTIQGMQLFLHIEAGSRNLQITSFSFDASVFEIFIALISGAALYLADEETRKDPARLEQYITDNKIDFALIPPAYLRMLEIDRIGTLKKLMTAGEAAIADKARSFLRYGKYYNAYGPTETSICATIMPVTDAAKLAAENVPIGFPIANSPVYIVDAHDNPVPIGVNGEICVGGAGLARGYLNREKQTAEKFVMNPFAAGERMYRTGDLGRWLPDGAIEYTGRKDEQVKIHGYRIEPAEIERVLQDYPGIETAVVIPVSDKKGEKELVAYFVAEDAIHTSDLVTHLMKSLPVFMLPSKFVPLDSLPLTHNGKLDKKALPLPESSVDTGSRYVAPVNSIQRLLAVIWQEVLGRDSIGILDDYFELGGNSLKAMVIIKKVLDATGVSLPMKVLFEEKTIEAIATHIAPGILVTPSYNQLAYFSEWNKKGDHLIVIPYESDTINVEHLSAAINQLANRHEILRTEFIRIGREIKQHILPEGELDIQIEGPVMLENRDALDKLIQQEYSWEPDLFKAPLFRVRLFQVSNGSYTVLLSMHHIITDGYSIGIIKNDLTALYAANAMHLPAAPPLKYQYRHFAEWQRNFVDSAEGLKCRAYWLKKLEGAELRTPFPALPVDTEGMNNLTLLLEGGFYESLTKFSRKNGLTMTSLLMGALVLVIQKLSEQSDITICTTVSGRNSRHFGDLDVTGLIGFFADLLIVRNQIKDPSDITGTLKSVQSGFLDDLHHEGYPFEKLIYEIGTGVASEMMASAVFFNYHNYNYNLETVYEQEVTDSTKDGENMKHFGLVLVVKEYQNCLKLNFIFNKKIFLYAQRTAVRDFFTDILKRAVHAD